jgi:hypothetical protein
MAKKSETCLAIVKAKIDNMPVLIGADTRTMEDMVTVVIHEELEACSKQTKELEKSLEILRRGGKADVKMAAILRGYYEYVGRGCGKEERIPVSVSAETSSRYENGTVAVFNLFISKTATIRMDISHTGGRAGQITPEGHTSYLAENSDYLPAMVASKAWAAYIKGLPKADAKFSEEYVLQMAVERSVNIAKCGRDIEDIKKKMRGLNDKKNQVAVIAAKMRIENSSVTAADMDVVKKFLGV